MTFQPYRLAEEELKKRSTEPFEAAKKIASYGAGIVGTGSLISRALPLLSEFIPENVSKKGLSRLSPELKNFINQSEEVGYHFGEVRTFLSDKIRKEALQHQEKLQKESEKKEKNQAPVSQNIVAQYSPELHEFIVGEIQKGRNPLEAGALAQMQQPFKSVIKKLTEDHRSPFSSILQTVYGENPSLASNAAVPQQPSSKKAELTELSNNILQALQKMRGNG